MRNCKSIRIWIWLFAACFKVLLQNSLGWLVNIAEVRIANVVSTVQAIIAVVPTCLVYIPVCTEALGWACVQSKDFSQIARAVFLNQCASTLGIKVYFVFQHTKCVMIRPLWSSHRLLHLWYYIQVSLHIRHFCVYDTSSVQPFLISSLLPLLLLIHYSQHLLFLYEI